MSNAVRRFGLPALFLLLVGTVAAQPPGEALKKSEDARKIEAQKLEIQFSDAIRQADAIGKSNPRQAIQVLQEATAAITADTQALTPERRAAMLRKLDLDRKAWGDKADFRPITPGPSSTGTLPRGDARVEKDSRDLVDYAKRRYESGRESLNSNQKHRDEYAKADLAYNKVMRATGIPETGEMKFPADWDLKMKRTTGVKLTEQEKAIIKVLGALINIDYKETTFKDIIDDLQKRTGQPFVVDPRALEEANVKYDTTITLNLPRVTTRTALKRILADLNLTYVVKDQSIQITTPARAKDMMSIRTYSVADLMPVVDMRMPLVLQQAQAYQTLQMLVVMITQNVEPDSWEVNGKGGHGTIIFDPVRFMLVVKQTAEVHYLMGLSGR